jgi:cytochrome P450
MAGRAATRLGEEQGETMKMDSATELETTGTRSQRGGKEDAGGAAKEPPVLESVVLDRADPDFLARANETYAEMRAMGPVVRARQYPFLKDEDELNSAMKRERPISELLFVSRYEEAASALTDARLLSAPYALMTPEQREKLPPMLVEFEPIAHSLIMLDPPDHTRLRKLVQPSFNARAMEALKPRIQRIADELLDKAEQEAAARGEKAPDRRMDLLKAFAYSLPVKVISDMLGIPEEDRDTVQQWSEFRVDSRDPAIIEQARKTLAAFTSYLLDLFERKRRTPADDMITQMVHAQEDGDKLSEKELLSMVFILYLGGHLTTENLIGNGVVALLTHPEQLARFKANPGLASGVVEETLRYWAPADFLSSVRTAREDMEIGGVPVPRGAQVTIGLASANRDPGQFKDPDTFDISRANANRHFGFGKGIHVCIGAPLARIEGAIAFETLFRRFPELRLAVPAEELRWGAATGLRGFREIPLLF